MVLIDETKKAKIINSTSYSDYNKGLNFPSKNIKLQSKNEFPYYINNSYLFRVNSTRRINYYYFVKVIMENDNMEKSFCTCPQYELTGSCKHLAAVLINYNDLFFKEKTESELYKISKSLFNNYINQKSKNVIKKELFIDYKLIKDDDYWSRDLIISLKVGIGKKYTLSGKLRSFLNAYYNEKEYKFGKALTYDPEIHFFSEENIEILNYLSKISSSCTTQGIYLDDEDTKKLIPLLKNKSLMYESEVVEKIKQGSPFDIKLSKDDDKYVFEIDKETKDVDFLTDDFEYVYKDNIIYHTSKKLRKLISDIESNKIDRLIFKEDDLNNFSKSILPIVKKDIIIDSTVEDIVILDTPDVKIYFDLNDEDIVCNVEFMYNDLKIGYFDKSDKTILRDSDYEQSVIQDLVNNNFILEKKNIYMKDIEDIGAFLEYGLEEISKKYDVYTSQNFKKIRVNRKSNAGANFSLGQDNIMRYEFKIDNVSDDEIESILSSLKKKKKYFRLKSGDLLSLEDDNLNELSKLTDELNMDYSEIKANGGVIPKYYALYLDSLKKSKYKIINTDNLFDNFINEFNKYKNINVKFDAFEKKILRDYQFDGVKWLYSIHKCGFGGILADEMGLGKSLQTITFMKKILKEDEKSKFLIVVPTSLIYNWKNEFDKFGKNIQIELINGPKEKRKELLINFNKSVYITTYGILREDIDLYTDKKFKVCVIDEAQNIKNPQAGVTKSVKKIDAETKIALTGTPIENSVIELWSIFDFIMPGFLSSLVKFQGKYKINDFDDETNNLIDKLNKQIKPFILRRKKCDVAKDLPSKIENNIFIDLSPREMKLYASEVKRVQKEIDETVKNEGFSKARFEILKLITKLRQLCIDPKILYENFKGISSKIENLMKVVKEVIENGHKILLFTSFKKALDIVRCEFNNNGISSYTIDGSVSSKKRMELVNKFNSDDTNVFLIMLKSGGTGLNLTSADVVIHLDLWWNPQAENQATDRTHRIGQTKTVEVIKLVANGTIEEKILDLQKKKQLLSDKLIESDNPDSEIFNKLTEKDIKDLLAFENRE